MLRHLTSGLETWPLARPFRISRGVRTATQVIAVTIAQDGVRGRGEAVPYARYDETPESVAAQVAAIAPAIADGASRFELETLLPPGAARNAVDCALWDLEAGLGLARIAPAASVVTALTVGIDTAAAMGAAAAALTAPLVKVKLDGQDAEARLRAVRAAQPAARIIVDPNESWTIELLDTLQPVLAELDVAFVEQPLPAAEDGALKGFARRVPICADESCHVTADLAGLRDRYDIVNIKLDKTGGLTEALRLLESARAQQFGVMVGCMICTSLSIAPALRIAADYADLDGPWWLKEDRPGGITVADGWVLPPAPGFWGDRAA